MAHVFGINGRKHASLEDTLWTLFSQLSNSSKLIVSLLAGSPNSSVGSYREAAKECRRKKKEYIKCLENRVAVLENQNKALIEELKSLKELYCKSTSSHD